MPFIIRLQGPGVNPQDGRLYEMRTPCPTVLIHPARDARDGWEHCLPQHMKDLLVVDIRTPTIEMFRGSNIERKKIPDSALTPQTGGDITYYPSVVLESAWSESFRQLYRGADLWQHGTHGHVKVVVLVKVFPQNSNNRVKVVLVICWMNSSGVPVRTEFSICPPPDVHVEDPLLQLRNFSRGAPRLS
ncbi:hypothetical protein HOY80DRAFT_1096187 [Tuber brumale]|nr:hypothetical protein HOY80DRAFT_1096187 [Tuber brumale]